MKDLNEFYALIKGGADARTVLGVTGEASEEEIRKAYKKLVRRFHPDVAGARLPAEEKGKLDEINLALGKAYRQLTEEKGEPEQESVDLVKVLEAERHLKKAYALFELGDYERLEGKISELGGAHGEETALRAIKLFLEFMHLPLSGGFRDKAEGKRISTQIVDLGDPNHPTVLKCRARIASLTDEKPLALELYRKLRQVTRDKDGEASLQVRLLEERVRQQTSVKPTLMDRLKSFFK